MTLAPVLEQLLAGEDLSAAAVEGAIGITRWRELRESPCADSRPHPQARVRTGRATEEPLGTVSTRTLPAYP